MPSGLTAGLYEGEQSFEDYMWRVARGFGALVTLRDSPDAPIPEEFKPSTYHDEKLEEAEARLRELDTMTVAVAADRIREERERAIERRAEVRAERDTLRARYEAMLERVEQWEPPTPEHVGMKEYAAKALRESIDFDCGGSLYPEIPEAVTPQGWVEKERERAMDDIEYHSAERAKEIERAQQRTAWTRALRDSLTESEVPA